ncbi:hypothetical protein L596_012297 [Steinernema carpocapsae]|uniref:Dynein light chain n=1 Tax=Steinernema carpocapsae TaxID=34508 RepID=A0A4U5NXH0_STECR|nr:hypothetical protein L596_012297 [Steinernema carpocapsae]
MSKKRSDSPLSARHVFAKAESPSQALQTPSSVVSFQSPSEALYTPPSVSSDVSTLRFGTKARVVIKASELPLEMIQHAVHLADEAMRKHMHEGDIAQHIKQGFDACYPPPWHCIVGRKFSSLITHEEGSFLYFFMAKIAIVLFKCKD